MLLNGAYGDSSLINGFSKDVNHKKMCANRCNLLLSKAIREFSTSTEDLLSSYVDRLVNVARVHHIAIE